MEWESLTDHILGIYKVSPRKDSGVKLDSRDMEVIQVMEVMHYGFSFPKKSKLNLKEDSSVTRYRGFRMGVFIEHLCPHKGL